MMSAKFVGIFRTFDPLPLLPSVLPCGTIPNPNSFHIWYHSRNAQGPEELPPEGVADEAVDGEVGRGVEHHERVRDVGHHLAPVRRQVRPVRLVRGAPGAGEEEECTQYAMYKTDARILRTDDMENAGLHYKSLPR